MLLKRLITVTLLASLVTARLAAAQNAPAAVRGEQAEPRAVSEQGLSLLREVAGEASGLRLAENRALVQATAADLLWPFDERLARSLLDEATANLNQLAGDEAEQESLLRVYGAVRQDVLRVAARRDPQFARSLLQSAGHPAGWPDDASHFEMSLAMQMAAKDPEQAAVFATETLKRGLPTELPELITRLRDTDRKAAAKLAGAVAVKLRASNLANSEGAARVALELLRLGSEAAATPAPLLDQQSLRGLADALAAEAVSSRDDEALLLAVRPLLPEVERYAPARAPLVRRQLARLDAGAAEPGGWSDEDAGTDEEAVESAAKRVAADGPPPRANTQGVEERVAALVETAKALAAKNEEGASLKLLEEARGLVGSRARNLAQLCAQLQLAEAFAEVDPARGLDIAEAAVRHINELAEAAVVVDGFVTDGQIAREGELVLKSVSASAVVFAQEEDEGFSRLARADFKGARRVVDGLQRPELRLMARLLILRKLLTTPPPGL